MLKTQEEIDKENKINWGRVAAMLFVSILLISIGVSIGAQFEANATAKTHCQIPKVWLKA